MWYQILSELAVNIASGWFAVVFIEPQLKGSLTLEDIPWLILKFIAGIISLFIAKDLRGRTKRRKDNGFLNNH